MTLVVALLAAVGAFFLFDGLTATRVAPRAFTFTVTRLLAEAGMRSPSPTTFVVLCFGSFVVASFVSAGLTSSPVVSLAVGCLAGWGPVGYVRSKRRKRIERLRDAWPDAIAGLVAAVRAGTSLAESCALAADGGPVHLKPGFESFRRSYRSRGSFRVAIGELQRVLADPIADRVCASLLIAHDVGGNDLVRTLRALGDFVRDDLRIRREIEARWSWTVTAARVAASAPWIVLLMMATRPEAARAYNSATGLAVVAGGVAATILGYRLMLRAARLPDHRRLAE